jgi:hypothetical protein
MIIFRTGGNAQDVNRATMEVGTGVGLVAPLMHHLFVTTAETDANAITIKFQGTATADNDVVQEGMIVEFLN